MAVLIYKMLSEVGRGGKREVETNTEVSLVGQVNECYMVDRESCGLGWFYHVASKGMEKRGTRRSLQSSSNFYWFTCLSVPPVTRLKECSCLWQWLFDLWCEGLSEICHFCMVTQTMKNEVGITHCWSSWRLPFTWPWMAFGYRTVFFH